MTRSNRPIRLLLLSGLIIFTILKIFFIDMVASRPLNDYDEARYAEVSKNMILTNEILIPLAGGPDEPRNLVFTKLGNGQELYPFFWKPPFVIWLQAISMKLFGINEFAARIPSLLASLGSIIVLFKIMRIYHIRNKLIFALLFSFSLSYDFSFISSQGTTDAVLTFLGMLVILLAHKNGTRVTVTAGIITGLALLTKSIAAFWIPLMFIFVTFHLKKITLKCMVQYILSTLFIAAPWFIYMFLKFGNVFIERHFLFNASGGAAGGQNFAPPQWYVIYMLDMWKPFIFLLPIIIYAVLQDMNEKKWNYFIPFIWICSILLPFSLSKSKVWWYIYPMWPPFILLLALSLQHIHKNVKHILLSILLIAASFVPYWQLSSQHIPLKSFLILILVAVAIATFGKKSRIRINARPFLILLLSFMVATTLHWYRNYPKNPTQNTAIKKLASRNQGLSRISVLGMPYEAALFYFNTGNVITDIANYQKEDYVLHNKLSAPLDLTSFSLIDQEDTYLLYKRNK